jgi:hypothetical protein
MQNRDYPTPEQEHVPDPNRMPPQSSIPRPTGGSMPGPYYMPPYYPLPQLTDKPPMDEVDRLLPTVRFMQRPRAYKFAIGFLITGITFIIIYLYLDFSSLISSLFPTIIIPLFLIIVILGFLSIIFLIIPKKIGWYFAFITSVMGLAGLPFGTPVAMLAIVALLWPSTRYYFHTGQYPSSMHYGQGPNGPNPPYPPYLYNSPYPMHHIPSSLRKPFDDR